MKTYLITEDQLKSIDSGLTLAEYFIQDNAGGSMVEQWENHAQTLANAVTAFKTVVRGENHAL